MVRSSLTGKRCGKWRVGQLISRSRATYVCTCDCGNVRNVVRKTLLSGKSTQCRQCATKQPRPGGRLTTCRSGHNLANVGTKPTGGCRMCAWTRRVKATYGITVEEFLQIYEIQQGKCAICAKPLALSNAFGPQPEGKVRTEIDHKHIPKKVKPQPPKRDTVRGLLCGGRYAGCNARLGHVDDAEWLQSASRYLLNPPAKQVLFPQ